MSERETINWPDLGLSLYETLTGRNAEITYEFQNLEIYVPKAAAPGRAR
jgi:hypothetical protein